MEDIIKPACKCGRAEAASAPHAQHCPTFKSNVLEAADELGELMHAELGEEWLGWWQVQVKQGIFCARLATQGEGAADILHFALCANCI
jgi:hypothetical protein